MFLHERLKGKQNCSHIYTHTLGFIKAIWSFSTLLFCFVLYSQAPLTNIPRSPVHSPVPSSFVYLPPQTGRHTYPPREQQSTGRQTKHQTSNDNIGTHLTLSPQHQTIHPTPKTYTTTTYMFRQPRRPAPAAKAALQLTASQNERPKPLQDWIVACTGYTKEERVTLHGTFRIVC